MAVFLPFLPLCNGFSPIAALQSCSIARWTSEQHFGEIEIQAREIQASWMSVAIELIAVLMNPDMYASRHS